MAETWFLVVSVPAELASCKPRRREARRKEIHAKATANGQSSGVQLLRCTTLSLEQPQNKPTGQEAERTP